MCGFAAVHSLQVEGMASHESNALVGPEIGQPIPGKEACDRHHETLTGGRDGLEKRFRGRLHILVQHNFPVVVHDTDVHTPGMQVDPAVQWVRIGVESPEVSSSFGSD
jgi:hypothetical protein